MALIFADRVLETTTTTGTGAIALAGAVTGYQRFSAAMSTSDTCYYSIFAVDGSGNPSGDWETGIGTYSAANQLTRTEVAESSNAGAAVDFAAGTKYVMLTATAEYLADSYTDEDARDALAAALTEGTGITITPNDGADTITIAATGYIAGGTDVAVADGGTGASDASGARTNLSAAAMSQTGEQISGFIASPSDKSYTLCVKMAHAGTITETTTISASGTCTATFKINSTALGGTANSVSSAEQSQAHASNNAFSAGDDIVLTISSNSSCADMSFTIKYTRTLA